VRDGKIVEFHSSPDIAGMMMQLGFMPQMSFAGSRLPPPVVETRVSAWAQSRAEHRYRAKRPAYLLES
jgi:hypothetical protein